MNPIEFLRQFRVGEYAIFDFAASFLGVSLLAPLLSKLMFKCKIFVPKKNWLFLTLPIGILAHVLVGNITPLTRDFLDLGGNFVLKLVIILLVVLGLRGVRVEK